MILTDKFVYIHLPKTGGTFVQKVLNRIHAARGEQVVDYYSLVKRYPVRGRIRDWLKRPGKGFINYYAPDHHAGCDLIPPSHRGKPIFTNIRNPFDHYVSEYEFRAWAKEHSIGNPDIIRQTHPHYPDLSFEEFVSFYNKPHKLAPSTSRFIRMFYRNGADLVFRLNREGLSPHDFKHDLYPVTFLPMEDLNQQLYNYLREAGYPQVEIQFILDEGKIYPGGKGRNAAQKWQGYYTPELKDYVRQTESFLFEMFPQYDGV